MSKFRESTGHCTRVNNFERVGQFSKLYYNPFEKVTALEKQKNDLAKELEEVKASNEGAAGGGEPSKPSAVEREKAQLEQRLQVTPCFGGTSGAVNSMPTKCGLKPTVSPYIIVIINQLN